MKLTLLRHGVTEGNLRRLYYGATDIPLLPQGRQALRRAKETGVYPTAGHYYTSGLGRTEETLRLLYGDVPHEKLPGLREMDFGCWEGVPWSAIPQDAFGPWMADFHAHRFGGRDSVGEMMQRVAQALGMTAKGPAELSAEPELAD